LSCLDQDAGPSALFLGDDLVDAIPEVNAEGCDDAQSAGGVFDEDEEEEEIQLIRKNSRHYRGNNGAAIFPPKPCRHSSAFKGFQYQTLIKHWKRSFPITPLVLLLLKLEHNIISIGIPYVCYT
jgi:hypothetical protein